MRDRLSFGCLGVPPVHTYFAHPISLSLMFLLMVGWTGFRRWGFWKAFRGTDWTGGAKPDLRLTEHSSFLLPTRCVLRIWSLPYRTCDCHYLFLDMDADDFGLPPRGVRIPYDDTRCHCGYALDV